MVRRLLLIAALLAVPNPALAKTDYPTMLPVEAYLKGTADEVDLARSAAPASVSGKATVLVLGRNGYETAETGTNGFVCIVARGWGNTFEHREFYSPKVLSPICYNPASARSVLPSYLERSRWVMAGKTKQEMLGQTRAAVASGRFTAPEPGSMCYMMSPRGYLDDNAAGPWKPHLMYFMPRTAASEWGANVPGSPVLGTTDDLEPISIFLAPVPNWSDGTSPTAHTHS